MTVMVMVVEATASIATLHRKNNKCRYGNLKAVVQNDKFAILDGQYDYEVVGRHAN